MAIADLHSTNSNHVGAIMDISWQRFHIKLKLYQPRHFHFFHGGVVRGLVLHALKTHHLGPCIVPVPFESGQSIFQAGQEYGFGLTFAGNQPELAEGVRHELQRIGQLPLRKGTRPTLEGNFDLISFEQTPFPDLQAQCHALSQAPRLTLRFLTPLRIKRPDSLQTPLRTHLDGDCFPTDYFLQRLHARLSKVLKAAHAISGQDARFEKPSMPEDAISAQIKENRLYWLDAPLKRGQGKSLEHAKPHLGAVGYVVLANVPEQWLPPLVMGQYLHLGESLAFGLGRYVIEEGYTRQDDPFRPTRSILDQAMDMPVLHEAVHHVLESSDATGLDSQSPADFQDNAQLQDIRSAVLAGNYTPSALQGVLIPKASGGLRPLAIPTVRDRITQRAVYATLSPTVDTLLEDCSYAYRKGLSRRGAANAINRAYREGFRYVLDADITCFFDSVPWDRLFAKLDAFFPFDPVVGLLKLWTTAPVMFDDRRIERNCGLPQGTSISPLLANLYLDEFDEELLGADFRLVRYADDFVVLCRDMDAAKAAWNQSAQALHKLGLSLHPDKTGIRDIDHGFTYLGFLFCRSLVLEKKKDSTVGNSNDTSAPFTFPACSWLAQVPMQRLMDLAHHGSATSRSSVSAPLDHTAEDNPIPERSIASDVHPDEKKLPLYILDPEVEVTKSGNALEIRPLKGSPQTIPLNALSHAVFIGRPRLSLPGLLGMHQAGIPTFFCRRSGALNLAIGQDKPDWKLWMAQARLQEDEDRRLVLSRAIVAGKLFNQAGTLVRFKLVGPDDEAARLRAKARMCENATHLDELRGIEGSGATLYFLAMRRAFPTEWAFQGREKRPPPDPINAMLSFGYTLLHNHVSTALQIAGFNPRIGVYHQMRGTHHALASDVQEEFRHLVDGLVLSKVRRREARLEHFTAGIRDGKQSSTMDNAFCKGFISAFETRLLTTFKDPDGGKTTYRACMDQQAFRLRETILKGTATYTPMRIQR